MTTDTPPQLDPKNIEASLAAMNEVRQKIVQTEAHFQEIEAFILAARTFMAVHADKLERLYWRYFGWTEEIAINVGLSDVRDPKEIARRFGADGWQREPDSHTCGVFDWIKTFDGVKLRIEKAETVKPQINTNVRL